MHGILKEAHIRRVAVFEGCPSDLTSRFKVGFLILELNLCNPFQGCNGEGGQEIRKLRHRCIGDSFYRKICRSPKRDELFEFRVAGLIVFVDFQSWGGRMGIRDRWGFKVRDIESKPYWSMFKHMGIRDWVKDSEFCDSIVGGRGRVQHVIYPGDSCDTIKEREVLLLW